MYVELRYAKRIADDEERGLCLSISCGGLNERIDVLSCENGDGAKFEMDSVRFLPENVQDLKEIVFELSNRDKVIQGKKVLDDLEANYCNGFTFSFNVCQGVIFYPVKVRFKNFPNLPSKTEKYPFYNLFSGEYQLDPLMKNIIGYLSPIDIISSLTNVSKYICELVKDMSFEKVVLPLNQMSNNYGAFLNFIREFRIIELSVPELLINHSSDEILKHPFSSFPQTLVRFTFGGDEFLISYRLIFDHILCSCPNLRSIFLPRAPILAEDVLVGPYNQLSEKSEKQGAHLSLRIFQTMREIENHDLFVQLLFEKCPNIRTIELGYKESIEETDHYHYDTPPVIPIDKDCILASDEKFDHVSAGLDVWSDYIPIHFRNADSNHSNNSIAETFLYHEGVSFSVSLVHEKNWSKSSYPEADHLLVFTLSPVYRENQQIPDFDLCMEVRSSPEHGIYLKEYISCSATQDQQEKIFVIGKYSDQEVSTLEYSVSVNFRYKIIRRYKKELSERKKDVRLNIAREYPIGLLLTQNNVDSIELDLTYDQFQIDATGDMLFEKIVKFGPCRNCRLFEWMLTVEHDPKKKAHGCFIELLETNPVGLVADCSLIMNNTTNKFINREFIPPTDTSHGFSPIHGVEHDETQSTKKLRVVFILEVKEIFDMEQRGLLRQQRKAKIAEVWANREGRYVGRAALTEVQIGKSNQIVTEEVIQLVDDLEWKLEIYTDSGAFKKPAIFLESETFCFGKEYLIDCEYIFTKKDDHETEDPLVLVSSRRYFFGEYMSWGWYSNEYEIFTKGQPVNYDFFMRIHGVHKLEDLMHEQNKKIQKNILLEDEREGKEFIEEKVEVIRIRETKFMNNIQINFSAFGFETWNMEFLPLGVFEEYERRDCIGLSILHPFVDMDVKLIEYIEYELLVIDDDNENNKSKKIVVVNRELEYNTQGEVIPAICMGHKKPGSWTIHLTVRLVRPKKK